MIIQVGDNETLRDDSIRFGEKAKAAGVDVQLQVWKGMFHCFPCWHRCFRRPPRLWQRFVSLLEKT